MFSGKAFDDPCLQERRDPPLLLVPAPQFTAMCYSVYCPRYYFIVKRCQLVKPAVSGSGLAPSTLRRGHLFGSAAIFGPSDVARNTSGSSHCFIREHINNFQPCTCVSMRKKDRDGQRLLGLHPLYLYQSRCFLQGLAKKKYLELERFHIVT